MESTALLKASRGRALSALSGLEELFESHAAAALAIGIAVYIIRSIVLLRQTPLEWDEYLTYGQAHLPTFAAFWSTLLHAPATADPPLHPLLMFVAVRASLWLRLAMRLPSFIAYLAFMLSVFVVLRRRAPVSVALIGFLVPMLLPAYSYACTARPYALMLGFAGCAFALWQKAAQQDGRRAGTLILLFLCLSGCLLSHYFGASIFVPLIAGELWRAYRAQRIDWPVWRTLIAAGCVVLVYIPFLHGAYRWQGNPYHGSILNQVLFEDLTATYGMQITPVLMILLMVCILLLFARLSIGAAEPSFAIAPFRFRSYEAVAIAAMYCIPVIVFVVAKFSTRAYYPRYSIVFVFAISVLIAALVSMSGVNLRGFTSLVALGLLIEFGRSVLLLLHPSLAVPDEIDRASIRALDRFPDLPITSPNTMDVARLMVFGAPPEIKKRLIVMHTPGQLTQIAIAQVYHLPVETPGQLMTRHPQFVLIGLGVQSTFAERGARITYAGRALDNDLALVETHPGSEAR